MWGEHADLPVENYRARLQKWATEMVAAGRGRLVDADVKEVVLQEGGHSMDTESSRLLVSIAEAGGVRIDFHRWAGDFIFQDVRAGGRLRCLVGVVDW